MNYVDAKGEVRTGVPIRDIVTQSSLHLVLQEGKVNAAGQMNGEHIALADYNEDKKTPNTWHFADEAPASTASPSKAFKPGEKAPVA